jgi:hypothetical protein
MNVLIIPIYKRIPLALRCINRLLEQSKRLNFDIVLVGVNEDLKQLPDECIKLEHDNPVSDKLNFALKHCKEYDKVMIWGSDNFASDSAIDRLFKSKAKIVGFDKIYFHSVKTGKWSQFQNKGMSIGVGRTYKKSFLKTLDYNLYDDGLNIGLDSNARQKYDKETILKLGNDWLLDVKFEQNITGLDFSDLVPTEKETVGFKNARKSVRKVVYIEVIKPFAGMKEGVRKRIPLSIAKTLIERNLIKIVS